MKSIRHILANQKGAYFLMSAIVLSVMVGFSALGVEIGRWYAIQAEISKSIDGAAFAGAKNINNPLFPDDEALEAFVVQVAQANFPPGLLDTDAPAFVANLDPTNGQVTVNGSVNSVNHLTTIFETGTATTAMSSSGSALLRRAEIALVLDVSGSMGRPPGDPPIDELRPGATGFVDNFESFQKDHKMALVHYAAGVQVPFDLGYDFKINGMNDAINALTPDNGGTNSEDALAQTGTLDWTPGQMALPVNVRIRQVVVFFSDGEPTAFRGSFTKGGNTYDAVEQVFVNNGDVIPTLKDPYVQNSNLSPSISGTDNTGNGQSSGPCGSSSTKWHIFDDATYGFAQFGPTAGLLPEECNIGVGSPLKDYVEWVARQKTFDHATALKTAGIELYTIGLGDADEDFMKSLATDDDHAFFANSSAELAGIFQEIANKLKLILVS